MKTETTISKAGERTQIIERSHHMVMTIGLIETCDDETLTQAFSRSGKQMKATEIRRELKRLRDAGLTYYPMCDNHGPDGACLGHENPHRSGSSAPDSDNNQAQRPHEL
jgi:hypothetical protein